MNAVPVWVWAALSGAVFGAAGALVGWLLERVGFKWGRWLTIFGISAGLAFTRSDGFHSIVARITTSDAQVERSLAEQFPTLTAYLKTAFPKDFSQMVQDMRVIIQTAPASEVQHRSAELVRDLRWRYAKFVQFGSDEHFQEILTLSLEMIQQIYSDSPATCSVVAIEGPMALVGTPDLQRYSAIIERQAVPSFKAMRTGIDSPVARRTATDADWAALGDLMAKLGASDTDFNSISVLSASDLNLCPALASMLRAMSQMDGEPGEVLRANYLAEVAAS